MTEKPNWVNIIPEFLAITDAKEIRVNSSKEILITEAKKLIRHEKFHELGERKKEKILTREINQFRDNLEMNRNLNRMHLEAAEELAQLEKRHRQIRAIATRTITQELIKKPQIIETFEPPKIKKKSTPLPNNPEPLKTTQKPLLEMKRPKGEEKPVQPAPELKKTENMNQPITKKEINHERKNSQFIKNYVSHKAKLFYWTKWRIFVAVKRKEKADEKLLREKINNFMQRLHERSQHQKPEAETTRRKTAPAKSSSLDEDLQDISKAIEKSAADTRNQLRSKSVQSLHPGSKAKAKLIRLITAVSPKEEEIIQDPIQYPPPQVLIEMNRKHDERKQRLAEIQEKKRHIEEEKDRIAKEKYEQQLFEAEQEKRRKIREFREKLRKERLEQEKRQQEWKRLKELNQAAVKHYERKLLKSGLNPLLRLVEHRRSKNKEAIEFNEKRIKRAQFSCWKAALKQIQDDKTTKALALRAKHLLKTWYYQWRGVCYKRAQQLQVAQDWRELVLIRDAFQAWVDYIYIEQREHQDKWEQATRFCKTKLLRKCLKHWMLLPQVLYLEREKEHRKRAWREKVQQVLPDFTPIINTEF